MRGLIVGVLAVLVVLLYDPAPAPAALRVPTFAYSGDMDLLAGNPDATVRTFPGLDHLMEPSTTGSVTARRRHGVDERADRVTELARSPSDTAPPGTGATTVRGELS
ncbi:MAG: hypothetical protein L0I24_13140 [Pseudonocardia sp.]|nr:hypothetical protein [Pseudonocardia sp.]